MTHSTKQTLSRRRWLQGTAGAGAAVALPMVAPAAALGLAGATAPSERIGLGVIGTGAKANSGTRNFLGLGDAVEVRAFCDPDDRVRQAAVERHATDPKSAFQTRDFRELLDRDDVDAVLIVTPDHWHAAQAIAAAQAGKHIFCEKPLSNTIAEGRAVVWAVQKYNVVFQHGTQLKSRQGTRRACELVRNGRIGELKAVRVGSPPGHAFGYPDPEPVPDWLDWNMWQGPAPEAPYQNVRIGAIPGRGLRGWYFISDYSKAGWIAGHGVHDIDIAQWALGLEETGPVEIEGEGSFPETGLFDTVLTYQLEFRYANGMTIHMTDTGRNRHGVTFEGSEGTVFTRGGIETTPKELAAWSPGPDDVQLYDSRHHEGNFIECIRAGRPTITPVELAHRSTSTCLLGGIAVRLGRKLRWDPQREQFLDDEQANRLLSYAPRSSEGLSFGPGGELR